MLEKIRRSTGSQLRRRLLVAVASLCWTVWTHGATYTWNGASGPPGPFPLTTTWSNAGNWAALAIPQSADTTDLVFGLAPLLNPLQDLGNDFKIH